MTRARLRAARPGDVAALVELKQALRLAPGAVRRGGFLLGCSEERYRDLVRSAFVTVLEVDRRLAGFAVVLHDAVLRASELWARRRAIAWRAGAGEPPEGQPIAYFDQLALAPWASRLHAAPLALAAVRALAVAGHRHLYATTIAEPVCNPAALPLLRAFGTEIVGSVRETYPDIGSVLSWLHHAPLPAALAAIASRAAGRRVAAASARLAA